MKTNTTIQTTALSFAFLMTCSLMLWAEPLGTTFTYQGRLLDSNIAADGQYDFQFKLFGDPDGTGLQVGSTVTIEDLEIVDGYFIADLDFGSTAFDGQTRFLQIAVRSYDSTDPDDYIALTPLQPITAAPYSQYALKSGGFSLPISLTSDSSDALFRIDGTGSGYSIYGTAQSSGSTAVYGYHAIGGNMGYLGTSTAGVRGYSASDYAGLFDGKTKVTGNLTVEGTANAGIGTAAPAAKLHVSNLTSSYGMLRIENSAAGDNEATMGFKEGSDAANSDIWVAGVGGWGNTNDFVLGRGAAKFLVEPDGDVGIGTVTPSQKLEVSGAVKASRTGADGPHFIIHDSNASNDRPGIQFTNNYIHYIGGDDGSNETFGFYSQYGYIRNFDAVVNIHGKTTGNWGKYLSLTHDGANGMIGTDSGDIILKPSSGGGHVNIGTDEETLYGKLNVRTDSDWDGIYVTNRATNPGGPRYGIYAAADGDITYQSYGVTGEANSRTGDNFGVYGKALSDTTGKNYGIYGYAANSYSGNNYAVYGYAPTAVAGQAWAGYFEGRGYVSENLSVGTNSSSRKFFVNGDAGGTTAWYNDSDERLKKNIVTIDNALEKVSQLRGVQYEWKDTEDHNEGKQIGFIGQEAVDVVPEVVNIEDSRYSMQYAPLTALLVEAVKEQQKQIETLRQELRQLKETIDHEN